MKVLFDKWQKVTEEKHEYWLSGESLYAHICVCLCVCVCVCGVFTQA